MTLDRRAFLSLSGAVGLSALWRDGHAAAGTFGKKAYSRAMVIDAMGGIGDPEPDTVAESPPSARLLQDLRDSGVTALSITLSVGSTGDRMMKAIRRIALFDEKVAAAQDVLMRVRTAADLDTAKATRRVGLIYNLQDSSLLENDLTRVKTLQLLGVRVMQLTYNTRNLVGDGSIERANSGLSNLGRRLVAELNAAHIVVDLSHSGQRTIAEGIAESKAPPVISHTGCRALADYPRNTYDEELEALSAKGGVAGIYFMPFLSTAGHATRDDLIRHIEHAVNVCGEDHVGLGTDGSVSGLKVDDEYRKSLREDYEDRMKQGIAAPGEGPDALPIIPEYNEPRRFLRLADDLAARGWSGSRIEKLLGANFARVYREVWGG
jgi:membrane dipeptidase